MLPGFYLSAGDCVCCAGEGDAGAPTEICRIDRMWQPPGRKQRTLEMTFFYRPEHLEEDEDDGELRKMGEREILLSSSVGSNHPSVIEG